MPGCGVTESAYAASLQTYVERPTANGPDGAGSSTGALCSTQRTARNASNKTPPRIANFRLLDYQRLSVGGVLCINKCFS